MIKMEKEWKWAIDQRQSSTDIKLFEERVL